MSRVHAGVRPLRNILVKMFLSFFTCRVYRVGISFQFRTLMFLLLTQRVFFFFSLMLGFFFQFCRFNPGTLLSLQKVSLVLSGLELLLQTAL